MTTERRVYVLVGDVTKSDVRSVLELAEGRGFAVLGAHDALRPEALVKVRAAERRLDHPLPPPQWKPAQLYLTRPRDHMPNAKVARQVDATLMIDNIHNAADLTRIRFAHFMRPKGGLTPAFTNRSYVLDFMIKNQVPFKDLVPAEVFYSPVADAPQLSTFSTMLDNRGIRWLELLAFLTPDQLRSRGFLSFEQVEALSEALEQAGLEFSSGH